MNWYLNLVTWTWRKMLLRHAKIALLLVKYNWTLYFSHSIEQSGNSQYLKSLLNVNYTEHGKPYRPHCYGLAKLSMVSQWQQRGMVEMVKDIEKSKCLAVMARIGPWNCFSLQKRRISNRKWQDCGDSLIRPI